jgi:hypothetical protein
MQKLQAPPLLCISAQVPHFTRVPAYTKVKFLHVSTTQSFNSVHYLPQPRQKYWMVFIFRPHGGVASKCEALDIRP